MLKRLAVRLEFVWHSSSAEDSMTRSAETRSVGNANTSATSVLADEGKEHRRIVYYVCRMRLNDSMVVFVKKFSGRRIDSEVMSRLWMRWCRYDVERE